MTCNEGSALAAESSVTLRWEPVPVDHVTTQNHDRSLSPAHVEALKSSFALLGGQLQLQPIVLDGEFVLIDGAHRLEAARQSDWSHIAAVIVSGATQIDRPLIEAEANRVRRSLSVLELEEVWRTHYEPGLRAAAKQRQLKGLRHGARLAQIVPPAQSASTARRTGRTHDGHAVRRAPQGAVIEPDRMVIGISNNDEAELVGSSELAGKTTLIGETDSTDKTGSAGKTDSAGKAESLARAAKRITGLSLDTLNKVSQIRELSTAAGVPAELQLAAASGLARLAKPGVSVESVYRALRTLQLRLRSVEVSVEDAQMLVNEAALERLLSDTSLLAEKLSGALSDQVFDAARGSQASCEILRAARVALTHSLAATVSLECNLEAEPARALQRIGAEVTQLLAKASRSRLDWFASARRNASAGDRASDRVQKQAIERTAERTAGGTAGRTVGQTAEQPAGRAVKRAA